MFEPRVRGAAGNLPPVPGGNPGVEERPLEVLGLQQIPRNPVLHVHPEGRRRGARTDER